MKANVDITSTWTKYRDGLCQGCQALCCTMPVEVDTKDLIKLGVIGQNEIEIYSEREIYRLLLKQKIVQHFNQKTQKFTLFQKNGTECLFLDKNRKCTVYEKRPTVCENHPHVGPRPGYCAYEKKTT